MKVSSITKKKYVPCELNVVQFNVEHGFAGSFQAVWDATNAYNAWSMTSQNGSYRNEGYEVNGFNWGGNSLPNTNNQ